MAQADRPFISRNLVRLLALLVIAGGVGAYIASRPNTDPEAMAAQVSQYIQDFKYDDALRTAEDALQTVKNGGYPDEYVAKFYIVRGRAWEAVYEWDFALSDYTSAVEHAPDYPEAYYFRGAFYATRNEIDLALADFATLMELAPNGPLAERVRSAVAALQAQQNALDG